MPEDAALALAARRSAEVPTAYEAMTSPAVAACRTAEALGLAAIYEPALRDLDAGRWTGKVLSEIAPDDLAAWLTDPDYAGHGGESVAALLARIDDFLTARLAAGSVVAVSHGAVLRAALVAVLGAPPSAFWHIDTPPLSMLSLNSNGRRWALRGLVPPAIRASDG